MTEPRAEAPDGLTAISALGEPTRRALYEHIAFTQGVEFEAR